MYMQPLPKKENNYESARFTILNSWTLCLDVLAKLQKDTHRAPSLFLLEPLHNLELWSAMELATDGKAFFHAGRRDKLRLHGGGTFGQCLRDPDHGDGRRRTLTACIT